MTTLPLFPDHVRCETCQHWGASGSGTHRDCTRITTDPNTTGPYVEGGQYGSGGGSLMTPTDHACKNWLEVDAMQVFADARKVMEGERASDWLVTAEDDE